MSRAKTIVLFTILALPVAGLGASTSMARHRVVGIYTGQHARALSNIYQSNQQHSAVINQVQRNIHNEQHTRY